jgi:hypothetical protein
VQLRSLRAHVRNLEKALDQEVDRAEAQSSVLRAERHEAMDEAFQRVRATIRGLGAQLADDQNAVAVLDRLDVAIARLGTKSAFERPALSEAGRALPGAFSSRLSVLSVGKVAPVPAPALAVPPQRGRRRTRRVAI